MPNMSLTKVPMPEDAPEIRNKNFEEVARGYGCDGVILLSSGSGNSNAQLQGM